MLLVSGCRWLVSAPHVFSFFFSPNFDPWRICLDRAQAILPHVPLVKVSHMAAVSVAWARMVLPWKLLQSHGHERG